MRYKRKMAHKLALQIDKINSAIFSVIPESPFSVTNKFISDFWEYYL